MRRRAIGWAALAAVYAAAEGVAAAAAGIDERAYFGAQTAAAIALTLCLALIPLPARWTWSALPVLAGGAHVAQAAVASGSATAVAWAAALGHAALLAWGLAWCLVRVRPAPGEGGRAPTWREVGVVSAAVGAQSLACGALLVNQLQAPHEAVLAVALACATAWPLASAAAVAWGLGQRASMARATLALAASAALIGLPLVVRWPVLLLAHRRLPPTSTAAPAGSPDVVLIVLDTTRADRLGEWGHARPTSPRLDEFAQRSTRYADAVSPAVWTLPGHASIFTGLYPSEHDADHTRPLAREAVTLAEWFRAAGYRTACFAANQMFRESAAWGLTQGFEVAWCEQPPVTRLPLARAAFWCLRQLVPRIEGGARAALVDRLGPFVPTLRESQPAARDVIRPALAWLDAGPRNEPRLLFVNLMEAHGLQRFHDCGAPRFGASRPIGPFQVAHVREVEAGLRAADPADLERLRDSYDSALACLDRHVGELLDGLEERGLLDGALVAVVADHGEMLGDQGAFGHRGEVWQGLVHVPLIVKLPGQVEGSVCSAPTDTAALAAALPALAGLPPLPELPRWAGAAAWVPQFVRDRMLASEPAEGLAQPIAATAPCPLPQRRAHPLSIAGPSIDAQHDLGQRYTRGWIAVRDGKLKLFEDSSGARWAADLESPTGEVPRPLDPAQTQRLELLLRDWRAEELALEPGAAEGDERAAERMRVLKQLGYTQGG